MLSGKVFGGREGEKGQMYIRSTRIARLTIIRLGFDRKLLLLGEQVMSVLYLFHSESSVECRSFFWIATNLFVTLFALELSHM
jgi:hypothetical protein